MNRAIRVTADGKIGDPDHFAVFRILVVEDNLVDVHLLRTVFKGIKRSIDLRWVKDGAEVLDLLAGHQPGANSWTPNLILLDLNMPRVSGLEALEAIKKHPGWRLIPVIVLSTSAIFAEVIEAYRKHANAFVQKSSSVERCERLALAIEAFWMDFAVQAEDSNAGRHTLTKGTLLARELPEVRSHAMDADDSITEVTAVNGGTGCEEHRRLMGEFAAAVKELLTLHEQQFQAIVQGDSECNRFDLLIHMANEKKQRAKYAYLRHVESHGCPNLNVLFNTSGT
ncbi:MAG TPA: response regulator [Bryobacteraceae bacterium]|nr:response regulator [Bryobacteraceae bacterium]